MPLDYDQFASTYRARYEANDYRGVEEAMWRVLSSHREILEVGCGTGHWLDRFAGPERRIFGVDPSMGMLRLADSLRGRRLVRATGERLPFASGRFDLVFAINALHHFDDVAAFVGEAARVLRPGGSIATVGLDPSVGLDRWYIYDYFSGTRHRDRQRYLSTERIRKLFDAGGFTATSTDLAQHIRLQVPARDHLESPVFHRRCTSQLALLPTGEFERGVARIEEAIRVGESLGSPALLGADLRLYITTGRRMS